MNGEIEKANALSFENVSKAYDAGVGLRYALRSVSFVVEPARRVAVVGRSGSGKSTLLHLAAGIDVPTGGTVRVGDRDLSALSEEARTKLRRDEVGLIFQFFYLMPHLPVADNVALPAMIAGEKPTLYRPRVMELLERVELGDRAGDPVQKLSGGEQQRVAICRALLLRPGLLLADEPTGNLDDDNGRRVMELMMELVENEGATLVYVTHSREFATLADDVWELHSGELCHTPRPRATA
ncbi:MAG: ABC transporter ATP-binding protein [Gemmatimonadota bacterium]|nr:ABC transporter ATP-binding protein [Gemmatimonadota bacterium]